MVPCVAPSKNLFSKHNNCGSKLMEIHRKIHLTCVVYRLFVRLRRLYDWNSLDNFETIQYVLEHEHSHSGTCSSTLFRWIEKPELSINQKVFSLPDAYRNWCDEMISSNWIAENEIVWRWLMGEWLELELISSILRFVITDYYECIVRKLCIHCLVCIMGIARWFSLSRF